MQALRIGIPMIGNKNWHGGILYTINLAKALRCQKNVRPFILAVISPKQIPNLLDNSDFIELCDKIVLIGDPSHFHKTVSAPIPILNYANLTEARESIDFIYPTMGGVQNEIPNASWIPDFQHHYLPEFFSPEELNWRTKSFAHIAEHARMLVLSSEDARNDFHRFYPDAKAQTEVLYFRSSFFIPEKNPWDLVNSIGIPEKFILCCNQFWAHKDHETLFRALGYLKSQGMPISLVCTGGVSDYRNHHHFDSLIRLIEQLGLQNHIKILGFIPRNQQIALMRCCVAIVQPSLFEGWSTVLEDARCLGTRMIASDLAVHREQNLPDAIYFKRRDPEALAIVLAQQFESFPSGPYIDKERNAQILSESQLYQYGEDVVKIANRCIDIFLPPHKVDSW
jgi:glycosyltransferase involved in cell wall biosynthesis